MPNITFLSLIVFELERKTCFRLKENGLGMAWNFGKKEMLLCVRLIEHYISAKFQTCTINTYRFTEDQRKFREKRVFSTLTLNDLEM